MGSHTSAMPSVAIGRRDSGCAAHVTEKLLMLENRTVVFGRLEGKAAASGLLLPSFQEVLATS